MLWLDYRKKLNLSFDDKKKAEYFSANVLNELSNLLDTNYSYANNVVRPFFNMIGERYQSHKRPAYMIIQTLTEHSSNLWDFISCCIALLNCSNKPYKQWIEKTLVETCKNAALQYELVEDGENIFLFPKGAEELDAALVSQPLEWMNAYSNSRKIFASALQKYTQPDLYDARTIADEFRKALEGFFQEFFNSGKSLENLKSEYGSYLKGYGVPKEIASNLENLLQLYTNYMNNYVKHKDNASDELLEYIMYQTGNIIRLLITLKKSESAT